MQYVGPDYAGTSIGVSAGLGILPVAATVAYSYTYLIGSSSIR